MTLILLASTNCATPVFIEIFGYGVSVLDTTLAEIRFSEPVGKAIGETDVEETCPS